MCLRVHIVVVTTPLSLDRPRHEFTVKTDPIRVEDLPIIDFVSLLY